jgi:hypothetical protein
MNIHPKGCKWDHLPCRYVLKGRMVGSYNK